MLQDVIQLRNKNRLIRDPLRHHFRSLLNTLNNKEFNKPLYSFTLAGLILGTIGLYMSFNSVQYIYLDGSSFDLQNTVLMILITLVGTITAFIGFCFTI